MKLTNGQKLMNLRHEIEMIGRELSYYVSPAQRSTYDMGTMLIEIKSRIAAIRQESAMYRFARNEAAKQQDTQS